MYPRRESPLQDTESSQEHSTELARRVMLECPDRPLEEVLARLTIHGERDELTTASTSQPGPPRLTAIITDRHGLSHRRYPTTTHPALGLQHRESNIRSNSSLPSRSSTPPSTLTPLLGQSTTTATYFTGGLTAASQMVPNTDQLLVAYQPPPKSLKPSASEVDLHHPPRSSGNTPTPTHTLPLPPELERRSTLPRYEARGGSHRLSPSYASSSSDLLSTASYDDDGTSLGEGSPEPPFAATAENNPWDQYVEKLGVSKYRCTYIAPGEEEPCGQRGDKRHLVTRHIKAVHLKIRPYKCAYCQRRFPSNSGLETHINTHTGETPYECPFCQRGFADRAGLHRHKVKEHDYQPKSRRSQPVFMPPEIHPHD